MLRTRLAIVVASFGIAGVAMFAGSVPVSAQVPPTTVTVSPNPVAPGAPMSYTIGGAVECTFAVRIEDANGVPFLQTDPFKTPGTSASFPAPTTPGSFTIQIVGRGECATASSTFEVQAQTTVPPTTAAPTTAAPTTTAAAAVPPAPTTAAPTTAAPAAPAALPATGQELNLAVVALLLCLGGGGLVAATRRH